MTRKANTSESHTGQSLQDHDDNLTDTRITDISGDVDTQEALRAAVAAVNAAQTTLLATHQANLNHQSVESLIQERRHRETEFQTRMTQIAQLNNQHGRHVDHTLTDNHGG